MAVVMSESNRQRVRVALIIKSSPPRMPLEVIIPAPFGTPLLKPTHDLLRNLFAEPVI
jgi:hypothetical protein